MTYEEALDYLASLAPRGWRLGLDRMAEFERRAGLEHNLGHGRARYIHVAGTNGKGSVTAYVQSILVEAGCKAGAFFSPYVYDMRERVQVGRDLIPKEDFARITEALRPIADTLSETEFGGITEFEFKTAIGFQYWTECQCDWVALEVGLGGRLDSTNIIDPAASVIVSIGLDHISVLGDTYESIAREKAGVIKPGRPVMMGRLPESARHVVEAEARAQRAPLWRLDHEIELVEDDGWTVRVPGRTVTGLRPGITGTKQPEAMALAVAACVAAGVEADDQALRKGASKAYAPGRFEQAQFGGRRWVLDGAHNGEAAAVLADTLRAELPGSRFTLITGMVRGHDPARFYTPLAPLVDRAIAVPIEFHRAYPVDELSELATGVLKMEPCSSVAEAIERACLDMNPILVTGSFYLVGDIGRRLGLPRRA